MKATSFNFISKALLGLLALGLFVLSYIFLSHVYVSLTLAFVLAYLLNPIVEYLQKKAKMHREWGALIALAVFFLVITLLILLIIPKLASQGTELMKRIPQIYAAVTVKLAPLSVRFLGYNVFQNFNALFNSTGSATTIVKPLGSIVGEVFSTSLQVITAVLGTLIIPLMAYYLMRDYPVIDRMVYNAFPKRYRKSVTEVKDRLGRVFGGFVRGQLGVSSILAVYYSIALTIAGVELSLVLGLMAGFLNIIPYLGILSVLLLTLFIGLVHAISAAQFIAVGAIFALGMALEGSFLTPKIVGKKVGLSPLALILALLVGSELQGLVGMLLSVPVAAIAKVFLDFGFDRYKESENYNRDS